MITIKQAPELWCPMVRLVQVNTNFFGTENSLPFNRGQDMTDHPEISVTPSAACCIGDKCAMWRWGEKEPNEPDIETWTPPDEVFSDDGVLLTDGEPPRPPEVPADAVWEPQVLDNEKGWHDGAYWIECEESHNKRIAAEMEKRRGYCGLAGRPA